MNKTPHDFWTGQFDRRAQAGYTSILQDEIEEDVVNPDEEFSFESYSSAIVSIINGSQSRFCVGIYGEWGTGKTTLMKLIERKLKPHIFYWENVPGKDNDKLQTFLKNNLEGFEPIDYTNLNFEKNDDDNFLKISDSKPSKLISIILDRRRDKAKLVHDERVYSLSLRKEEKYGDEKGKLSIRENNVLSVWFNAWRYEREEQFALVPLLKTIAFAMGEHPFYKELKPILLKGIEILSKDILRNVATRYIMTEHGFKEFEKKLLPKLEQLPEIDKDTIYFNGIKKIEDEIRKVFQQYPQTRIVIFIDDLDRCSPETTLEIFESVKAFLDIEGFVFILGLSRETLDKLITKRFEKMGLTGVTGEQYIRKIVQIEINIQEWQSYAINSLITALSERLDYEDLKKPDIIDLIAKGVERNPRQVKRLINRYIVAYYANKNSSRPFETRKFFVGEILNQRWPDFYRLLTRPSFLKELKEYVNKTPDEKKSLFVSLQKEKEAKKDSKLSDFGEIIVSHKGQKELWEFVTFNKETILISETEARTRTDEESAVAKDWVRYKRARDSTTIRSFKDKKSEITEKLLRLLEVNKIREFNSVRSGVDYRDLNFANAKLPYADLFEANLSNADLSNANLISATIARANFTHTNLANASLSYATLHGDFSYAILTNAKLDGTKLENANFSHANLSNAYILLANLSNTDLSNADLRYSTIVRCIYNENTVCNGAQFDGAIIDDEKLVDYLKNSKAINVPLAPKNKVALRRILKDREFTKEAIEELLTHSNLK